MARRRLMRGAAWACGAGVLTWTLLPVYNIVLIALSDDGDEFTGAVWPQDWSFKSFRVIWTQDHWYLRHFWHQFGNSVYVGLATMGLTVLVGSAASFAIGRLRPRHGWLVAQGSLLTYAVPASFLVIPFTRLMHLYGLMDSLVSVIAAEVAFATPFAILILQEYGRLIPLEVDEAAQVDGASPWQVYRRIYLPLAAPALAVVAIYALLLSWNEYLYQFLLLSSSDSMTVAGGINQFFDSDEAPWNDLMAVAVVYSLPPIAIYFALRRGIVAGLAGMKS